VFELHRTIGGADRYKVVFESSPGLVLSKAGDRKTVWGKVTVDEDFGNFTILAKAQLELKDTFGNTNRRGDGSYYELAPPPKEVRLWTMGTDKTARLGMMVAAFPLSLSAAVLLAAGAVLGLLGGARERAARWAWRLCLAGSVLAILAVLFYVLGIGALIDLTGYGEWFGWNPQFYLAVAGAFISLAPGTLLFLARPPPPPGKTPPPGGKKPAPAGENTAVAKAPPEKPGGEPPLPPAGGNAPPSPPSTNKIIK
jgi:hypothetical protein